MNRVLFVIKILVLVLCMGLAALGVAAEGRVLEVGMRGTDVRELQSQLVELGYDISVDGIFGPKTREAVKQFQEERGLLVDGIVGSQTWGALSNVSNSMIHVVVRGDSLYMLARCYGVEVSDIMALNELTDDTIYVGQELIIPKTGAPVIAPPAPMVYRVRPGESAFLIAKKFNTSVSEIASANRLRDPNRLMVGQELVIPSVSSRSHEGMSWPVRGPISSGYGWRIHPIYKNRQFHGGIDIAVPSGTNVRAAASGVVVQSGWMGGFGYGVEIDHGGGISTWYGHNSSVLVRAGQQVRKGQVIARSGSTGVSTGPHLDFRVKVNGESVDPLLWLPR